MTRAPDSFGFKANDGALDSNVATVTIVVSRPIVDGTVSLEGMPNPISGARLTFSSGDQTIARVFSDPGNGSFEIQLISGIYDVIVEKDGFLPATKLGELVNQDMVLPEIRLLGGDSNGDGVIGADDLAIPAKNLGGMRPPGRKCHTQAGKSGEKNSLSSAKPSRTWLDCPGPGYL